MGIVLESLGRPQHKGPLIVRLCALAGREQIPQCNRHDISMIVVGVGVVREDQRRGSCEKLIFMYIAYVYSMP